MSPADPTPDPHLADLGVAELARRISGKEVSSVEVVEACLARIAERDPALNAFSVVLADQARAEAAERDRSLPEGEAPGPLHGVPVAIKEEIDVAGCVTTFGGRGQLHAGRRGRRGGTPAARRRCGHHRQDPDAGVRTVALHRVRGRRQHPQPVGPRATPRAGRAAARPSRWPPAWCRSASAATAAARSGSRRPAAGCSGSSRERGRVTAAPMQHLWWALGTAGPLARSVLDSAIVYDVIRGPPARRCSPRPRTGRRASPRPPAPSPAGCGSAGRRSRRSRACGPTRPHVEAVRETAQLLTDLGHEVVEVDPRYPDATLAFVPQFFAGVRTESDAVEHYDRLEKRTRETYRLGSWVRPGVVRRALRAGEKVSAKANRVFDDVDVLLTPTIAHRPAQGRGAGQGRHRAGRAAGAADDRLHGAVERHRQPGGLGAGGRRRRRPAARGAAGRAARTTRPRCSACRRSWSARARGRCRSAVLERPA